MSRPCVHQLLASVLTVAALAICATLAQENLDVRNPMVFSGGTTTGRDFGFSVSLHRNFGKTDVYVGAPRDDIPSLHQYNITAPGAIYRCSAEFDATCTQMPIVDTANMNLRDDDNNIRPRIVEERSYMRLGSSLMTSGENESLVMCASHYHVTYAPDRSDASIWKDVPWTQVWDSMGKCYVQPAEEARPVESYTPCNNELITFSDKINTTQPALLALCNTGVTLDIVPTYRNRRNRHTLLAGAPSYRLGIGNAHMTGLNHPNSSGFPDTPVNPKDQFTLPVYAYFKNARNDAKLETKFRVNTYTGWASTQGDFNGDEKHEFVFNKPNVNSFPQPEEWMKKPVVFVVSADANPRGQTQSPLFNNREFAYFKERDRVPLIGQGILGAMINDSVVDGSKPYIRILGQQLNEFFGYHMISYDCDNVSGDELYVSAPMYTEGLDDSIGSSNDRNGRVYVYSTSLKSATDTVFVTGPDRFVEIAQPDRILMTGPSGSQFGHAMARLGDINDDQINDMAIGAPFESTGGVQHGAVYIFLSSASGLSQVQRITPSSVGLPQLTSFGWSISPGVDVDGNGYNDLLVGAPISNQAVALRTRPRFDMSITMNQTHLVDFTPGRCAGYPDLFCIPVEICFHHTFSRVPLSTPIEITYTLVTDPDSRQKLVFNPLAASRRGNNTAQSLTKRMSLMFTSDKHCAMETVYLRSFLPRPCINSTLSLSWTVDTANSTRSLLSHIVYVPTQQPLAQTVTYVEGCSDCKPDLRITQVVAVGGLSGTTPNKVLIGRGSPTRLTFRVENAGRVIACGTNLMLSLSSTMTAQLLSEGVASCQDVQRRSPAILSCTLRKTLYAGSGVDFHIAVDGKNLMIQENVQQINISIQSSNPNPEDSTTLHDNVHTLALTTEAMAAPGTRGTANPSSANISSTAAAGQFTQTVHTHSVRNFGPGPAPGSTVDITYSLSLPNNVRYASLHNLQATSGFVRCSYDASITSVVSQASNGTLILYQVARDSQASPVVSSSCVHNCTMRCFMPALNIGQTVGVRLVFRLQTGTLRTGGHLGQPLNFRTASRLVSVEAVPGFQWNMSRSDQLGIAQTRIQLIPGGEDSGIPWIAIWLPIVIVLLLIILIVIILKHRGFFERGQHLEKLMVASTMAAMGAVGTSTDGIYRHSIQPGATATENGGGGNKRFSRPSLTRQESSI